MKRIIRLLFLFIILPGIHQAYSDTGISKSDYIEAIKIAEEQLWQEYQQSQEAWQNADIHSRDAHPPKANRHLVRMPALLYHVTKEPKYAERTRDILLNMSNPDAWYNVLAVKQLKDSGILTKEDLKVIATDIEKSADKALNYWVEWGAMNHATQSVVNNLIAAIRYLPSHPDAPKWQQKLDINISANWGKWSIEDAQIYIPAWNKPLMQYAEMAGREEEFYALPMTRYYFDYLVQLMTPGGQIAEFGDGRYGRGYTWTWMISILEKGAAVYRDGRMKWAAHRLFEAHVRELGHQPRADLCEAWLWADDSIEEELPTDKSRLVLEDYVGKKVVFRDGWDRNATFMLLNYMDDAPFGIDGKEYLINTINVEAEKNHHGHADENAICLLMKEESILLYDSNYRETSSTGPDGQFRADVFHNKLVVREGLADANFRLMPFLLDGGRYKFVNTKLMHFRSFRDVDISRSRLVYDEMGYQWDRLVNYLKEPDWFVIFDIVKIQKDGPLTLANLFYTQHIGDHDIDNPVWFDTYYSTIAAMPNLAPHYAGEKNDPDTRLLIYFPMGRRFRIGAEQLRNNVQTEWAIYTAKSDSFKQGDLLIFPTLLIPHAKTTDPGSIVKKLEKIKVFYQGNGFGLQLPTDRGFVQLNAMADLEAEYLEENIRPRYNFESGKAQYGDLITDARYCYLKKEGNELYYSFFKAANLIFKDQTIFKAPGMEFGQDNGIYRLYGVPKWAAWEDSVRLKTR
jgi:hypothetical protein